MRKRARAAWVLAIGVSVVACTSGGHDAGQGDDGGHKADGTAGSDAGVTYGGGGTGAAANGGGGHGANAGTSQGSAGVSAGGGHGSETGGHNAPGPARAHVTFQLKGVM